jgi:hypothetical protein
VIGHPQHINDEQLLDCYLARRDGEALDPPQALHLDDCADCSQRFEELAAFMDGLKADAIDETDAIFTAERLRQQREQIAARIEQTGRVARIISFPGRLVARHVTGNGHRVAQPWTAAAAAAGLFVGVALGMFVDREGGARFEVAQSRAARPAATAPAPAAAPTADTATRPAVPDYDTLLFDLDQAAGARPSPELRPLDVMTPHVYPISLQVR